MGIDTQGLSLAEINAKVEAHKGPWTGPPPIEMTPLDVRATGPCTFSETIRMTPPKYIDEKLPDEICGDKTLAIMTCKSAVTWMKDNSPADFNDDWKNGCDVTIPGLHLVPIDSVVANRRHEVRRLAPNEFYRCSQQHLACAICS
jgi:hypothetical protein